MRTNTVTLLCTLLFSVSLSIRSYAPIDRVRNITAEHFLENYLKPGKPVIITDVTRNMTKQEIEFWKVSNLKKFDWFEPILHGEHKVDSNTEKFLHGKFHVPYCLIWDCEPPDEEDVEIFVMEETGVSTPKHVDAGCSHTYAIQFEGKKLWRFWPFGDVSEIPIQSHQSNHSEKVYEIQPMQAVMEPGDAIVFPVGWWHQTFVTQAPCLSISLYWRHENPEFDSIHYNKKMLPLLNSIREFCHCTNPEQAQDASLSGFLHKVKCVMDFGLLGRTAAIYDEFSTHWLFGHSTGSSFNGFLICTVCFFLYLSIIGFFMKRNCVRQYMMAIILFALADITLLFVLLDTDLETNL